MWSSRIIWIRKTSCFREIHGKFTAVIRDPRSAPIYDRGPAHHPPVPCVLFPPRSPLWAHTNQTLWDATWHETTVEKTVFEKNVTPQRTNLRLIAWNCNKITKITL